MFGDCQWEWFMENPKLVRKKFIAVLKAAIYGEKSPDPEIVK
jgi:hypothetical protein